MYEGDRNSWNRRSCNKDIQYPNMGQPYIFFSFCSFIFHLPFSVTNHTVTAGWPSIKMTKIFWITQPYPASCVKPFPTCCMFLWKAIFFREIGELFRGFSFKIISYISICVPLGYYRSLGVFSLSEVEMPLAGARRFPTNNSCFEVFGGRASGKYFSEADFKMLWTENFKAIKCDKKKD